MRWMLLMISFCLLYVGNANAVIIDLNSRVNGLGNSINLSLGPGTYSITPIGIAGGGSYDAWNAWGVTTCSNPAGCQRTSPTSVRGWLNLYSFASPDLVDVTINGSAAVPNSGGYYSVDTYKVYPDPASALADALSAEFTLGIASVVGFAIPDTPLYDNLGGISLDINASSVPEPASIVLLGLGLMGMAVTRRKKGLFRI